MVGHRDLTPGEPVDSRDDLVGLSLEAGHDEDPRVALDVEHGAVDGKALRLPAPGGRLKDTPAASLFGGMKGDLPVECGGDLLPHAAEIVARMVAKGVAPMAVHGGDEGVGADRLVVHVACS